MSAQADFLFELGSEELPPKALAKFIDALQNEVVKGLTDAQLNYARVSAFASPRRLAILVHGLAVSQPDRTVERKGPAVNSAYDANGNPTKAAEGFAKSCGVAFADLEKMETPQGAWLVFRKNETGQPAANLLPGIINKALDELPIPKRMRWGARKEQFVRPVHWLIMLLGESVIPCEILGLQAGQLTRGHRVHCPNPITIVQPANYEAQLAEQGYVLANFTTRKQKIEHELQAIAKQFNAQAAMDEDLLNEVTALVEWPVPLVGQFEEKFLAVPQEALISTMQGNQKYFPLLDKAGKLTNRFVTIANIESKDPEQVITGNERVVRPRLSDAEFFFKTDLKKSLDQHNEPLKHVVFQAQLGTVYEKAERISSLAKFIAHKIGANETWAARAGLLCKADLSTAMVGEFPELQGIMGMYYAQSFKYSVPVTTNLDEIGIAGMVEKDEPDEIALALNEQYMPRFAGDQLPSTHTGAAVAIADKLDTLVGIFGIGKPPTGDKDPFGLRRAALGILRILIGRGYELSLNELIGHAIISYETRINHEGTLSEVLGFLQGRYRALFQDEGIATDTINSVAKLEIDAPLDFHNRIQAVSAFRKLPEATALAAANKRVANILAKAEGFSASDINANLLTEPQEIALADALKAKRAEVTPLFAKRDYQTALSALASLREVVDAFFDKVMVNADDLAVRQNRLNLLHQLKSLFVQVADISELQG